MSGTVYEGGCHCRAQRYRLAWPDALGALPARRCSCSYCTRFNGTWTSHPEARLCLVLNDEPGVLRYRFGTGTADFLVCAGCGCVLAALDDNGDDLCAVVNIHSLDNVADLVFECSDSDFDGETRGDRLARRQARWIGAVQVSNASSS